MKFKISQILLPNSVEKFHTKRTIRQHFIIPPHHIPSFKKGLT